jgi:SAM-dependent methyltransferase
MADDAQEAMSAEFGTLAEWTARVAHDLGADYFIPAACRGSGNPAALNWLLDGLAIVPGEALLDVGAGLGGPSAYANRRAGVAPTLVEPELPAARSAAGLFPAPVISADATALPFASGQFPVAWSLGVLCTAADEQAQLVMLRELRRVVHAFGRIGLLVLVAMREDIHDPPEGNTFPTPGRLAALLADAQLTPHRRASVADLPEPGAEWTSRTSTVEDELRRRYHRSAQWQTAQEQSDRITRLLAKGQLETWLLTATVKLTRADRSDH